jgi:hypothetical protein
MYMFGMSKKQVYANQHNTLTGNVAFVRNETENFCTSGLPKPRTNCWNKEGWNGEFKVLYIHSNERQKTIHKFLIC